MGNLTNIIDNLTGQKKIENKKTKLVTAIYSKLGDGFPFYGYDLQARTERFRYSLCSIANTNLDIVCYCSKKEYDEIKSVLDERLVKNVTLKIFELENLSYHKRMKEIRLDNPDNNLLKTPHEVMWGKYYFLDKEIDGNYDYYYWIDAGISHPGLFPLKYGTGKGDGMSRNPETWNFPGIFNQELFNNINSYVGEKLLDIRTEICNYSRDDIKTYLELNEVNENSLTIGGIVGGHKSLIKWFTNKYEEYGNLCLKNKTILDNEQILSAITFKYKENYKSFTFSTWSHEDFMKNYPTFDYNTIKDKTQFIHFFEKEIKNTN